MKKKVAKTKSTVPMESALVFTDGACSGNPGPGGWAAVIATPDGQVTELGGHAEATTNNRMELQGVIEALLFLREHRDAIDVYTDSVYVIRGITQWYWGWKKRGWKTAEGNEVSNQDLWEDLGKLAHQRGRKINWYYSRGHVGTPGNERCDEIAVKFSQKKYEPLYRGPLLKYKVAIYDVPEDTTLPEMKPKTEKVAAYSYLSLMNGKVFRHKDWASCERRVKGQSGAKFKKAMSKSDESEILAAWGLPDSTLINSDQ